ncbi:MAG: MFS transporter, partial [Usitatibacter sp.]
MNASVVAPHQAPPRKSFREVWLITLGHALTHWYPATFYLLLPIIGKELGLTYTQIGLVMTCQYVAGAVANIPGGILVDTVGRKGVLMALSLFWVGFPYLLMGFSHGYLMLLACVALVGFGNSLWHPTAIPTLARRFPERKGLVLSLHGMGGNVGDAFAPLAVGALLAVLTWREVVIINVIPGLAVSMVLLAFLGTLRMGSKKGHTAEGPVQSLGDYFRGVPALFRNRSVILL